MIECPEVDQFLYQTPYPIVSNLPVDTIYVYTAFKNELFNISAGFIRFLKSMFSIVKKLWKPKTRAIFFYYVLPNV